MCLNMYFRVFGEGVSQSPVSQAGRLPISHVLRQNGLARTRWIGALCPVPKAEGLRKVGEDAR